MEKAKAENLQSPAAPAGETNSLAVPSVSVVRGFGETRSEERMPIEKQLVQTIRAGMYVLVVVLALVHHLFQDEFFSWEIYRNFYAISALGLVLPVLSLPFLNGFFRNRRLLAMSFALDLVLITALLLTSRLNQSIFLFLYMMTIILTGLVFQIRGALLMALGCSLASTLVLLVGEELKSMGFFFLLSLNNIAFFSVAWISGFLAEQLEVQGLNISDLRRLNQSIVETIPSGLLTVLDTGLIIQANPGAMEILGLPLEKALEAQTKVQDLFPSGTFSGSAWPEILNHEVRISKSDETQILNLTLHAQALGEKPTFLLVIEDQTQVRKLEYAIRQSEKLAAVGQLATGIAHEIRNPLAGISGSIELLSQQAQSDDDRKLTRIILREIDRLNNLISEFLDFAKPEKPPVDPVDMQLMLDEVLTHVKLTPNFRQDIDFQRITNGKIFIRGHRDKLRQAFLNMVINACQALDKVENPWLKISTLEVNERIRVEISDNGCGMSDAVVKRMFEPFMTTKPKGTGLGLAITHKIFETHQAQIFVESKVGEGTRITIDFPRLDHSEKV